MEILAPDWTYAKAVAPSDTADNVSNALYLHNAGTSGLATVRFANGAEVSLFFPQGVTQRGGRWTRVKAAGLGPGVQLVAFY